MGGTKKGVGEFMSSVFGDETIRGRKFSVSVNNEGEFTAVVDGEQTNADTLRKLRVKIMDRLARQSLDIPFVRIVLPGWSQDKLQVRKGKVIMVHADSRRLVVEWSDGKRETLHTYHDDSLLRADTDVKQVERLYKVQEAAEQAYKKFVESNKLTVPNWRE